MNTFRCACANGYANGACEYNFITAYKTECTVVHSRASVGASGTCDVDVDECASSPCTNGAACSDSTVSSSVSIGAYQCTCAAGFADGMCKYTFIGQYKSECSVQESTSGAATLSGNCGIDIDECKSNPCANGAKCDDSTTNATISLDAYFSVIFLLTF